MVKAWLIWLIGGGALIAAELIVGSPMFVLLILGIAALVAALLAWAGTALWVQMLAATVFCLLAYLLVRRHVRANPPPAAFDLDAGAPVELVRMLSAHQAEVRYRGTLWQAEADRPDLDWQAPLIIKALNGNTLLVSSRTSASGT